MKKKRQIITDKQGYDWLSYQLNKTGDNFMRSKIAKYLKNELNKRGYWKNRERGNAREGGLKRKEQLNEGQ